MGPRADLAYKTLAAAVERPPERHVMTEPSPSPPVSRLRLCPPAEPFRVVLVEPEIPQNTGSISRTCVATGSALHLVEPLGFRIDEHAVRRAGLDHWPHLSLSVHASFADFRAARPETRLHLFSATAERSYLEADLEPGDALVFGRESVGLPAALLAEPGARVWGIPTAPEVRSLNVSNAVAIVLYEGLRRCGALDRTRRG